MNARHKTFLKNAKVPLPEPLPIYKHVEGLSFSTVIWLNGVYNVLLLLTDWQDRFAFFHETGHVFDMQHLTYLDRVAIARIIGHPGLRWWWGNWNPMKHFKQPNMENFADWYAECAMGAAGKQHEKLRQYLYKNVAVRFSGQGTSAM